MAKNKELDVVAQTIVNQCGVTEVLENGKTKTVFDFNRLIRLAQVNGLDVDRYADQTDPLIRGRVRMSIGNMLRGKFRKSGELLNIHGGVVATG
jgi:hypothetical protein